MPQEPTVALEAQAAQRQAAQRATLDLFRSKAAVEDDFETTLNTATGPQRVSFLFRAMGATPYDRLIDLHPATPDQRTKNPDANFNPLTFAPALLARVCVEPAIPESEWVAIWADPKWSAGELNGLFWRAVGLCNKGLDLNPTGRASE